MVAAVLLPDGLSFDDDGGPSSALVPDLPAFFDVLLILSVVALFVSVTAVVVALSLRGDPSAPPRRRKSPAGLLVLIVVTGLVASLYAASQPRDRDAPAPPAFEDAEGPGSDDGGGNGSRALGLLITGMVGLLVVAGPIAAWRYARSHVPDELGEDVFDELLLEEVDRSIADLGSIEDPRAAVIACYGRLQRLARWSGLDVHASDTSSEVLAALGRRSGALEASAARLVALFQTARFSPHALTEADRAEALAALSDVRDRLVVSA